MKKIFPALFLLLLIGLNACSTTESTEELVVPTIPAPADGMANVTGRVLHKETEDPFIDTIIRLAEVVRSEDGGDVYVLDQAFSPGTRTDEFGIFVFENVDPIEYVLIVGDVEGIYEVIPNDDGTPRVWNAKVNEVLNVRDLLVLLEPTLP